MSYFANFPVKRSPPSSVADKYTTATPLVLWEGVAVSTPLPTNNAAYSVMSDRSKINKYATATPLVLWGGVAVSTPLPINNAAYSIMSDRSKLAYIRWPGHSSYGKAKRWVHHSTNKAAYYVKSNLHVWKGIKINIHVQCLANQRIIFMKSIF